MNHNEDNYMRQKKETQKSEIVQPEVKQDLPSIVNNKKFQKLIEEFEIKKHELELKKMQDIIAMENETEVENRESNRSRARSVTVGTSFGGTTELMMRSDGGRHIWCVMQPVEVIELIHQLAANVGCHLALKPRDDFSSWRDWRVSEAEKKHLNGHAPFVNDMAVFQQLGASGFNQQHAESLMNFLADQKEYDYVNGGAQIKKQKPSRKKIIGQDTIQDGAPNIMIGEEDGLNYNKKTTDAFGNVVYQQGGVGGLGMAPESSTEGGIGGQLEKSIKEKHQQKVEKNGEALAAKRPTDKRKSN